MLLPPPSSLLLVSVLLHDGIEPCSVGTGLEWAGHPLSKLQNSLQFQMNEMPLNLECVIL